MSKTKYIKVAVSERLPDKTNEYFTDKGKAIFGSVMKNWHVDELLAYPNYWLCEVPDREQEMKEMLERCQKSLEYIHENAKFEFTEENTEDHIEHVPYLKQELEKLLNSIK
ncbi:hypothetical protein HHL23_09345 [Chryseobacterium sp. RP-3-3]|uniref:Uncharacterized protein n=1 Tax=Chryseobacterium antibioticum TaxID=2728847 RepID=A0A7Y0FS19_9FLAO|nr:hypothetical protein [Chryseobacterium antibioticum]NML70004.1 hypothetical protein [Chryseobacterium antibioticum]